MATITDVSKHAGVSRSTVSRVVAGNGYVSDAKRRAIEKAIAELGYRPNTLAQALRSNRSNMIGAVVVDVGTPVLRQHGLRHAARRARAQGKSLMVSSGFADQDEEARAVIELVDRSCDGLVLYLERPMRADVVEILRRRAYPGRQRSAAITTRMSRGTVRPQQFRRRPPGHDATCSTQGHRKIVHLTGQAEFGDTVARLEGIAAALAEHGMHHDDIHVVNGEFSQEFGYAATTARCSRRAATSPRSSRATTTWPPACCWRCARAAGACRTTCRSSASTTPSTRGIMWPPLTTDPPAHRRDWARRPRACCSTSRRAQTVRRRKRLSKPIWWCAQASPRRRQERQVA